MATEQSQISFTLSDLENLNLGQLLAIYSEVKQPNPPNLANSSSSQPPSQHLSIGRFNAKAHDVETGHNTIRPSHLAGRSAIECNDQHFIQPLSIETSDLESGELKVVRYQKRPDHTSRYHLDNQRRSPYPVPGQFDDAETDPDADTHDEGQPTSQNDGAGSKHYTQARTVKLDIAGRQLLCPKPAHGIRVEPHTIEEDYGQARQSSPYVSRLRSLRVYTRSLEGPRSWRRPSTGHTSRRSMSHRIRRKPLPVLLTWDGPLDPHRPVNWSRTRKRAIELACCAMSFIVSFASSIFFDAVPATATQFDTSQETMILGVSLYIVGSAIGKFAFFSIHQTTIR